MKLVATADLHYDIARSKEPTRAIAETICGIRADALLVLGDAAGRDLGILRDCLGLFDRFKGRKFFVAGNHDLWVNPGEDSLDRLEKELPEVCAQAGFHALDAGPAVVDGIALVGSVGWYDFSFRPSWLEIPLRFYREKIAPGAAARLGGYETLVEDLSDVPDESLRMGTRWMDGEHVRLPMSDVTFCHHLTERLAGHLQIAARQADRIIVGMHHLPFWEMVPRSEKPTWAFASTYMGSEMFGEVLLAEPKVSHVLCGHSHRPLNVQCGHITCIDVGCTYLAKRCEILELASDR